LIFKLLKILEYLLYLFREDNPALNEILSTKIQIPRAPVNRVVRSGLLDHLNQALTYELTLISAPAGYAKTMLLSEWVSQLEIPAGWVSLDESDGDVTRFLLYVIAALQTINPNIGQTATDMLQPPRPAPVPTVLTILINDIVRFLEDFVLILEVNSSSIIALIAYLHLKLVVKSMPLVGFM